jgi:hypothetical protein
MQTRSFWSWVKALGFGWVLGGPWGAEARALPPGTIVEEGQVQPYTLPDPLRCEDGSRVVDAEGWWRKRRPELKVIFEREMYGRTVLGRPEGIRYVVREEKLVRNGEAVRMRVGVLFEGTEEGRQMELLVVLPTRVKGPVPLFLGPNFDGNYTTTAEPDLPVPRHWAMGLYANKLKDHLPTEAGRGIHQSMWPYAYVLEHGYGLATFGYGEVEPDSDGRWKEGPRGLAGESGPQDWGSIGAWAWGLSRAMDFLETEARVDKTRVAVFGFSRLGKAALWAAAQDSRFAMAVSNGSGAGGAALSKRIFGETVSNAVGRWFVPSYKERYAGREGDLPMDQHELLALIAPRPLLITSATEDLWADPKGEFLAALAADPVYRLLGTEGLSADQWPKPSELVDSRVGYFLRPGGHEVTLEDWQAMIRFAGKHLRPQGER